MFQWRCPFWQSLQKNQNQTYPNQKTVWPRVSRVTKYFPAISRCKNFVVKDFSKILIFWNKAFVHSRHPELTSNESSSETDLTYGTYDESSESLSSISFDWTKSNLKLCRTCEQLWSTFWRWLLRSNWWQNNNSNTVNDNTIASKEHINNKKPSVKKKLGDT